jgi:hypothetical protein
MKMAIRIQNNWKEKQQQINGSLPAAPRCLPLQRKQRMAFSGFIKAGERADEEGGKKTRTRKKRAERKTREAQERERERTNTETGTQNTKENREETRRTSKHRRQSQHRDETKNRRQTRNTESREEAEKEGNKKRVRHRKRRLRNRGEGRPIAERRALIFFQNSSDKTPPPVKLLLFPSF